ncbi:MAG: hypothetical protein IJU45_05655 [Clostridia bacterium]|nr:hypothetical protein [Clostridia bacterium]
MKKIISVILVILQTVFCSVSYGSTDYEQYDPQPQQSTVINDIDGDSPMADSVKYASACSNVVQAAFTSGKRQGYRMINGNAILTHALKSSGGKKLSVYDTDGNAYFEKSSDPYYKGVKGSAHFASKSTAETRINTIRLGEYYYECYVRDLDFSLVRSSAKFKVDKCYHVFADRVYEQLSLFAVKATEDLDTFGTQLKIPVKKTAAIQIKDKNGIHDSVDGIDPQTVEYAAFDIKDAGVFAIIIPSDGSTKEVTVKKSGSDYIIDQTANYTAGTGINKYDETGGYELNCVTFGRRLYTDKTHSFELVDKEAYLERNPLQNVKVTSTNSNGKYLCYEALRGTYTFTCDGLDFNTAFKNPDLQFRSDISFEGDDYDRDIVVRMNGSNGCLEAAALLDESKLLVPENVQVCKNFMGDGGEDFYSVKDYQYGDSFFPIRVNSGEKLSFTLLNLYQNWGKYPLKQLSSIEYYQSYYHLSAGVTESNCISIYPESGWRLPDFRGMSSPYWSSQPQHNSVGIIKFTSLKNRLFGFIGLEEDFGEYTYGNIASVGQTYSDITYNYNANCGAYSYGLRHVEFPQTDENRTFYQVTVTFNTDMTFKNFKRDFTLYYMDGRFVTFNKIGFLDAENNEVTAGTNTSSKNIYHTLGTDSPYFGFYSVTDETEHYIDECFGSDVAFIVRDYSVTKDGKAYDVPLAVREKGGKDINSACLTLDAGKISFSKGDTITLDMILLPWGTGRETNDQNVRDVRFDSALNPQTAKSDTNEILNDAVIPTVKSENNTAQFTVSGGKDKVAVKVAGFTKLARPEVSVECGGVETALAQPSKNGYDGYSVQYEKDGTYTYSFVYECADPTA